VATVDYTCEVASRSPRERKQRSTFLQALSGGRARSQVASSRGPWVSRPLLWYLATWVFVRDSCFTQRPYAPTGLQPCDCLRAALGRGPRRAPSLPLV